MYEHILDDPKFDPDRMGDLGFRLFVLAMAFASRSPWNLKRKGWLYHADGFPVESGDFCRRVKAPKEEVDAALEMLCTLGGRTHSLMVKDEKRKAWRIPKWRKWQDGFLRDFSRKPPESHRDSDAVTTPIDVRRKTRDVRQETGGREGADAVAPPPPRPTWPAESDALKAIPGYPFDEQKDRALFDILTETYQQLDLVAEVKKCHAWLVKNDRLPLKGKVGPRRRIGGWIERADRYDRAERTLTGRPGGRQAPASAEEFTETGLVEI